MKFGIITHYDVHNHGALLQLNALIQVLADKGIEAYALQFDKNYDFLGIKLKSKYNISIKSIPFYLNYLKEQGVKKTLFNIKKRKILERFKREQHLIGGYYTDEKDLNAVIIGSDEVFALHTGPTPAFWGYALPSDNVFVYAGCFGPTTIKDITEKHCLSFVKGGLESMKALSVRDKNSYDIIKALTGKNAEMVCDPVLLYGYKKELTQLSKINLRPYLLIYAYDSNMNDATEIRAIRKYAKAHNLQIISAGFYHKWCDKNINVDPIRLLSYFRDAHRVITDTFHGSVMSILTNAEFAVKLRGNGNKLGNLLEEYIALKTRKYGFLWCNGNVLRAIDFCNTDGSLFLQIKNKSNTENSSSSNIREGTNIKKWFRLGTRTQNGQKYPDYKWADLNAIINSNRTDNHELNPCQLSEEEYISFLDNVATRNTELITDK